MNLTRKLCLLLFCCLHVAASSVRADEVLVKYSGRGQRKYSMMFIRCPGGEHIQVADFKVQGKLDVAPFLLAKEELSAQHYERLVAITANSGDPARTLPPLNELIERISKVGYPITKAKRESARVEIERLYEHMPMLPVFGFTAHEAELVCEVLEQQIADHQGKHIEVNVPTSTQWQYASRGYARSKDVEALGLLNFPVWPTKEQVQKVFDQSRAHRRMYHTINALYDRLMHPELDKGSDNIEIDLMNDEHLIAAFLKLELLHKRFEDYRPGRLSGILNEEHLFVALLRELLKSTIPAKAEQLRMPLPFGMSSIDSLMKVRGAYLPYQDRYQLLRSVNCIDVTPPNPWGFIHMTGNVREWVKSTGERDGKLVIAGCGCFDGSSAWRRALVSHTEQVPRTGDRAHFEFEQVRHLAGVRPALLIKTAPAKRE